MSIQSILKVLPLIPTFLPGKMRLARLMINWFAAPGSAEIKAQGLTFKVPSISEPIAQSLIAHGCYEPLLLKALASVLKPDGVFFDVGANIGFFSLLAAQEMVPRGIVAAFEASPRVYSCLEHNAQQQSRSNLHLYHRAVTEKTGETLEFYDAPESQFGMGSLANRFGISRQLVESISLDEAAELLGISRVDAIKVDVEGFELGVFRGATKLLGASPAPHVFFEFNDWAENGPHAQPGDAQRFLSELGYTLVPMNSWIRGDRTPHEIQIVGGAEWVAFKL